MKNKTEYRTISDGYTKYLQYKRSWELFFFISMESWTKVSRPYYDKIEGTFDFMGYDNVICGYNNNLDTFIKKWVYIDEYFIWAKKEQKRLKGVAKQYWVDHYKEKGKIEYK